MRNMDEAPQLIQDDDLAASGCGRDGCCGTTEDGNAICTVPQSIHIDSIPVVDLHAPVKTRRTLSDHLAECKTMWQKIRGGVMFVIACIASPCCTPLIIPVVLALLTGTPVAVWMSQNLGLVFGGLTLLSIVSFVLAIRWMGKNGNRRTATSRSRAMPVSSSSSEIRSQSL